MALTIFLAKVLGVYLLVAGAALLVRRGYFVPVLGAFVEERPLRMIVGFIELLAGLFLVMAHTIWTPFPAAIISVIGILTALEGLMYLILPDEVIEEWITKLNVPAWYIGGGFIAILLGIYLAGFGFGFF